MRGMRRGGGGVANKHAMEHVGDQAGENVVNSYHRNVESKNDTYSILLSLSCTGSYNVHGSTL